MTIRIHFHPQAGQWVRSWSIPQAAIRCEAAPMAWAGKSIAGHVHRAAQVWAYQAEGAVSLLIVDDRSPVPQETVVRDPVG